MQINTVTPTKQLIKLAAVCSKTAKSRSAIYAAIKFGSFPSPIPIGERAVAWNLADIDAWIDAQIAKASV